MRLSGFALLPLSGPPPVPGSAPLPLAGVTPELAARSASLLSGLAPLPFAGLAPLPFAGLAALIFPAAGPMFPGAWPIFSRPAAVPLPGCTAPGGPVTRLDAVPRAQHAVGAPAAGSVLPRGVPPPLGFVALEFDRDRGEDTLPQVFRNDPKVDPRRWPG